MRNRMGRPGAISPEELRAAIGGGYGFYLDAASTAVAGQNIAASASTFTTLSVDGLGFTKEVDPSDLLAPLYDVVGGTVDPIQADDMLDVRIQLTAENYSGAAPYLSVGMDVGGTAGAFINDTVPLLKGGVPQPILVEFAAFVGLDWIANGGLIQVRYSGNGSVDIYDKAIQVQRTFKAP